MIDEYSLEYIQRGRELAHEITGIALALKHEQLQQLADALSMQLINVENQLGELLDETEELRDMLDADSKAGNDQTMNGRD